MPDPSPDTPLDGTVLIPKDPEARARLAEMAGLTPEERDAVEQLCAAMAAEDAARARSGLEREGDRPMASPDTPSVCPTAPDGFVACRTTHGPGGSSTVQVTHLVRLDEHGSNGGRPTMCGLTRFDKRSPDGWDVIELAALPGWSMGAGGISGPGITQKACDACWTATPAAPGSSSPDVPTPDAPTPNPSLADRIDMTRIITAGDGHRSIVFQSSVSDSDRRAAAVRLRKLDRIEAALAVLDWTPDELRYAARGDVADSGSGDELQALLRRLADALEASDA